MKNKLKSMLAVVLSATCLLSVMPLSGFAAEKQTIGISEGSFTGELTDVTAFEGDEIVKGDEKGLFYVTVNSEKASEGYDENSFDGYKEENAEGEKSDNVYYESYTVPAAPNGYKDGAKVNIKQTEDFYSIDSSWYKGNEVNLEYTPVSYKVIFDLNGGEGKIEDIVAEYDSEITLPSADSVSFEGKKLVGWNINKDGGEKSYAPAEKVKNLSETDGAEITLYAVWMDTDTDTDSGEEEVTEYSITYYLGEDEQYGSAQKYAAGSKIVHPKDPEKEGFKFAGWILGEEDGKTVPVPETMPSNDLKAYASWEIRSYTISYTVDGTTTAKTALYGSDIAKTAPSDPEKEGYVFAGWFDKNGKNLYSYSTVPANDVEFTAKWLRNGNVTYLVDGKTYEAYEVQEGEEIPVPENPKKFAHKFKGWSPEVPEKMPSEDLEFKAQWEIDKDFITLVIGGTVVAGGIVAAIAGAAITGISIIGGIIAIIGVASNIKKSYTVTYKVDGSIYKTYKHEAGEKITVPANPTKSGYKFKGWTPEIPDEMPKKSLTFEATWSEIDDNSNDTNAQIPSTGSTKAGLAAFAALAISAVAAIIIKKKKDK
ncbi:MAG: InlB B-repeat-containing protein [Clostridia bacterium]|nr:InlB B-repeat-containing protein [Clostridia bacterium]